MSTEQRFQDSAEYELLEPYMGDDGLVAGYRIERLLHKDPWRHTLYEATNRERRRVMFKLLHPRHAESRREARRLDQKIRQRAAITHPHLVPIYDWGKVGDQYYVVTPLRPGPSLAELMAGGLDEAASLRLLAQLADALETAHEAGLVHRELAPENVLVRAHGDGHVLLGDFGIANPEWGSGLIDLSEPTAYVSPERLRDEPLTPQSNVYSLACILVECLTGSPPYSAELPGAVAYAHVGEDPPVLSERRADLPRELDDVVAAAMAKDPERRTRSPRRLIAAAADALGLEVPAATGPGPDGRAAHESQPVNGNHLNGGADAPSRLKGVRPSDLARSMPGLPGVGERIHELRHRVAAEAGRLRLAAEAALRRRQVGRALVLLVVGVGMLGFLLGRSGDDGRVTESAAPDRAELRRAAALRQVDRALDGLDVRRAVQRRRLATASSLRGQAQAAAELANAYRAVAQELLPSRSPGSARVALALREAGTAYALLATAARRGDRRGYPTASADVRRSEGELQAAITSLNDGRR